MSNAAAMHGEDNAYLVWGIDNDTHELTDTKFFNHRDVNGEPLEHYLARQITPDIGFSFHEFTIDDKRVVVLVIPAAKNVPTAFNNIRFLRIGSSKVNLTKYPERESQLFDILRNGLPTIESEEAYDQDLSFRKLLMYYEDKGIVLNRKTFENNCLLNSLDKVLEYGDVLNIVQVDKRDRLVERKEVPLFNQDAFRDAFKFRENSIVVTIPFNKLDTNVVDKVVDKVGDKTKKLNPTRQRILEEIRNNPNITQPQLMSIIGIGRTAIQNNITFLRMNGYIERVGSNKNGYWRVL